MMDRRAFLKKNVTVFLGGAFLANWGTPTQIRAYYQPGKPLLTERNLNRLFADAEKHGGIARHTRHARSDLTDFLRANFSLSPQQTQAIANISAADRQRLNQLLTLAESGNGKVSFQFTGDVRNPRANCGNVVQVLTQTGRQSLTIVTHAASAPAPRSR